MIEIQEIDFEEMRRTFDPNILDKVVNRALKVTADKTAVQVSKTVRDTYLVRANKIKGALRISNDDSGNVRAKLLTYTDKRIGLINFSARPVKITVSKKSRFGRTRTGVKVKIKKGKAPVFVKGAFFAQAKTGGVKIYQRVHHARKPLRILTTLSVPQMIQRSDVVAAAEKTSAEVFPKEMEIAINFFAPKER